VRITNSKIINATTERILEESVHRKPYPYAYTCTDLLKNSRFVLVAETVEEYNKTLDTKEGVRNHVNFCKIVDKYKLKVLYAG